jgi:hypothetical protein
MVAMKSKFIVLLILAVSSTAVHAQDKVRGLVGVTQAQLYVGGQGADTPCGWDSKELENLMKFPILAYTKIKEGDDLHIPSVTVFLWVTAVYSDGLCAFHLRMSASRYAHIQFIIPSRDHYSSAVDVWSNDYTLLVGEDNRHKLLSGAVEELVRGFIKAWQQAN